MYEIKVYLIIISVKPINHRYQPSQSGYIGHITQHPATSLQHIAAYNQYEQSCVTQYACKCRNYWLILNKNTDRRTKQQPNEQASRAQHMFHGGGVAEGRGCMHWKRSGRGVHASGKKIRTRISLRFLFALVCLFGFWRRSALRHRHWRMDGLGRQQMQFLAGRALHSTACAIRRMVQAGGGKPCLAAMQCSAVPVDR